VCGAQEVLARAWIAAGSCEAGLRELLALG
jgi:hypothetical protein